MWVEQNNICKWCAIAIVMLSLMFSDAFAKLQKKTISFITSVCPHGLTWFPLDRFS